MKLPLHCAEAPKENEQRNPKILTMYPQVQGLTECTLVAKPIKTKPEKKFLQQLMIETKNMIPHPNSHKTVLPTLPKLYEVPDKQEIISTMYTRFSI